MFCLPVFQIPSDCPPVKRAEGFSHQHHQRLADQFSNGVAENCSRRPVGKQNSPRFINTDNSFICRFNNNPVLLLAAPQRLLHLFPFGQVEHECNAFITIFIK